MNITPQFIKNPAFVKYERLVGSEAYKHITLLGMYCQQSRNPEITIEDTLDLEILLDIESNGDKILEALLKFKLIEKTEDNTYLCNFFVEQNKQLLSNWQNGAMRAKKSQQKTKGIFQVTEERFDRLPVGASYREDGGLKFNGQ